MGVTQTVGAKCVLENVSGYLSDVDKVTDKTNKAFSDTATKASGLSGGMQQFGPAIAKGAAAGSLAIIGLGAAAVITAQGFEKALDSVAAVSQATNAEMKELHDTALRIGKETAFGATETAEAMELLAANGLTARQIIDGAADATVNLAAAGGTDLAMAADTASTAMTVWGLKTSELNDLVNRLAGAANVSRFGVEDMSMAIAQGGGAAAAFGVEIGDFLTTVAAIAPSFQSGSDAGTSLKTMFTRLVPGSKEAETAMRDLGIITDEAGNRFFDAQGNMKSMAEVSQILHDTTASLSEEQRIEALSTIFGSDSMRAAAALAQQTGASFEAMDAKMAGTDASKIAKQRMDNFAGSMEQLKGSLEVLAIVVGEKLIPYIRTAVDFITKLVNVFTNLPGPVQTAIIIGAALTAGVLALVAGFTALSLAVLAMSAASGVLTVSLLPIIAIVGAVVLAIIALAVIAYLIYDNWGAISEFFSGLWDKVKTIFNDALSWITKAVGAIWNAITGALSGLTSWVKDHWAEIATVLSGPFFIFTALLTDGFGIRSALLGLLNDIRETIEGVFDSIIDWFGANWKKILFYVLLVLFPLPTLFIKYFGKIKALVKQFVSDIIKFFTELAKGVLKAISDMVSGVLKFFTDLVRGVTQFVSNLVRDVVTFFTNLATTVTRTVADMVAKVIAFFASIPGAIAGALSSVFSTVTGTFVSIASTVLGTISGMVSSVVGFFVSLPGQIAGAISGGLGAITQAGASIIGAIFDGLSSVVSFGADIGKQVAQQVINAINFVINQVNGFLEFDIEGPFGIGTFHFNAPDIPTIPNVLAKGTIDWAGGLAIVGEQGPELVNLPQHAGVFPAQQTSRMLDSLRALARPVPMPDMSVAAPGQQVSVNMPVNIAVQATNWGDVIAVIHREIDNSILGANRTRSINAGAILSSGVG